MQVLVVDDHDRLRAMLSAALATSLGAQVQEARDLAQALVVMAATTPDVIVLDVNLPGVTGLDGLPQVRATCPRSRIVMMSAAVMPGLERKALHAGADIFIAKSAGLNAICAAVQPGWEPPGAPAPQTQNRPPS